MGTKTIEFTREFTSPVHGNVYETKRVTVSEKEADKCINAGLAVSVVDGVAQLHEQKAPKGTVIVSDQKNAVVDPYKGMTKNEKKAAIKAEEAAAKQKKADDEKRADELLAKAETEEGLTAEETAELKALGFEIEEGGE